jgi:small subunit ribosomal protein S8
MDTLSNMLSKLKNASMAGKAFIEVPHTKVCEGVAKVLKEAGFVVDVKTFKNSGESFKSLRVDVADTDNNIRLTDVKIVSKPGRRMYKAFTDIKTVAGDHIMSVVSTSRGIMSGSEARKRKLGGELICIVVAMGVMGTQP